MCLCLCVTFSVQLESGLSETVAEAQTVATGPSNPHLSKSFTLGKSAGLRLHANYSTSMIAIPALRVCVYTCSYCMCMHAQRKEKSRVFYL